MSLQRGIPELRASNWTLFLLLRSQVFCMDKKNYKAGSFHILYSTGQIKSSKFFLARQGRLARRSVSLGVQTIF